MSQSDEHVADTRRALAETFGSRAKRYRKGADEGRAGDEARETCLRAAAALDGVIRYVESLPVTNGNLRRLAERHGRGGLEFAPGEAGAPLQLLEEFGLDPDGNIDPAFFLWRFTNVVTGAAEVDEHPDSPDGTPDTD